MNREDRLRGRGLQESAVNRTAGTGGISCEGPSDRHVEGLMEAKEESARLVTKVEELELKTKKLMVYKAAHGFPESADELRQKVEELQVVLDAEVAKTTRLESSIDTLKGEEQLKAEAHESMVGEIQLQMDKQPRS